MHRAIPQGLHTFHTCWMSGQCPVSTPSSTSSSALSTLILSSDTSLQSVASQVIAEEGVGGQVVGRRQWQCDCRIASRMSFSALFMLILGMDLGRG